MAVTRAKVSLRVPVRSLLGTVSGTGVARAVPCAATERRPAVLAPLLLAR